MAGIAYSNPSNILARVVLEHIENELKKRCPYRDVWFRRQNNIWDNQSNFIYNIQDFDELIERIKTQLQHNQFDKKEFFYYSLNRWYNYWSARAVEQLFIDQPNVNAVLNEKDRLKDFSIQGISFDLKTTKFPKGFQKDFACAQKHPEMLIKWLYKNQSKGRRFHLENRLFLVVFAANGEHYKLKAEISWLQALIENYVSTFEPEKLISVTTATNKTALSDIIWATR